MFFYIYNTSRHCIWCLEYTWRLLFLFHKTLMIEGFYLKSLQYKNLHIHVFQNVKNIIKCAYNNSYQKCYVILSTLGWQSRYLIDTNRRILCKKPLPNNSLSIKPEYVVLENNRTLRFSQSNCILSSRDNSEFWIHTEITNFSEVHQRQNVFYLTK